MSLRAALMVLGLLIAKPLAAQTPCVGALLETDLDGAVDVERHFADVPSALFPGLWQEGRVGGYIYRIASNRTGLVTDEVRAPRWQIEIMCDQTEGGCERAQTGPVPAAARDVADQVARCILGDSPAPEEPAEEPTVEASADGAAKPDDAPVTEDAAVPEQAPVEPATEVAAPPAEPTAPPAQDEAELAETEAAQPEEEAAVPQDAGVTDEAPTPAETTEPTIEVASTPADKPAAAPAPDEAGQPAAGVSEMPENAPATKEDSAPAQPAADPTVDVAMTAAGGPATPPEADQTAEPKDETPSELAGASDSSEGTKAQSGATPLLDVAPAPLEVAAAPAPGGAPQPAEADAAKPANAPVTEVAATPPASTDITAEAEASRPDAPAAPAPDAVARPDGDAVVVTVEVAPVTEDAATLPPPFAEPSVAVAAAPVANAAAATSAAVGQAVMELEDETGSRTGVLTPPALVEAAEHDEAPVTEAIAAPPVAPAVPVIDMGGTDDVAATPGPTDAPPAHAVATPQVDAGATIQVPASAEDTAPEPTTAPVIPAIAPPPEGPAEPTIEAAVNPAAPPPVAVQPDRPAPPAEVAAPEPADVPVAEVVAMPQEEPEPTSRDTAAAPPVTVAVAPRREDAVSLSSVPEEPTSTGQTPPASGSLPDVPVGLCCAPWPVEDGNPVRTLQLLLAEAGFDPGKIDGDLGAQTRTAMIDALGQPAGEFTPEEAVAELAARRCNRERR